MRCQRSCIHRTGRSGQVTAETVLGIVLIVASLVGMVVYMQRGMQGNLFSTSRSFGVPFDPGTTYADTTRSTMNSNVKHRVAFAMLDAQLRPQVVGYGADPDMSLTSQPTGSIPREPAIKDSAVDSNWSSNRSASYNAQP